MALSPFKISLSDSDSKICLKRTVRFAINMPYNVDFQKAAGSKAGLYQNAISASKSRSAIDLLIT